MVDRRNGFETDFCAHPLSDVVHEVGGKLLDQVRDGARTVYDETFVLAVIKVGLKEAQDLGADHMEQAQFSIAALGQYACQSETGIDVRASANYAFEKLSKDDRLSLKQKEEIRNAILLAGGVDVPKRTIMTYLVADLLKTANRLVLEDSIVQMYLEESPVPQAA